MNSMEDKPLKKDFESLSLTRYKCT